MDVLIAGGHGKVARHLIRILAAEGHRARGLIRNPDHAADLEADGGVPVLCDLEREDPFPHAAGADAIVFAAGAGPGSGLERKQTVDLGAAVKCVEAAEANGVARFLMVSSIGAQDPDGGVEAMRPYLRAKADADARLAASSLDWTILRPGSLQDEPGTGLVDLSTELGAPGPGAARGRRARARRAAHGRRRHAAHRRAVRGRRARARGRRATWNQPRPLASDPVMRRIVERHLAKLRRAQQAPEELARLQDQLVARMYPAEVADRPAGQDGAHPPRCARLVLRGRAPALRPVGDDGALLPDARGAVAVGPREADRAPVEEAVERDDLLDHLARHRRVGGDDHHRDLVRRPSSPGGWRPTAADSMFTPRSPRSVPTRPIMPGRSQ